GIRSTKGLVSLDGVVPLNLAADVAGAVTRTVADTAAVLQTIAEPSVQHPNYLESLRRDALKGARLGVLHHAYDTPTLDAEVKKIFDGAIGELRDLGAEVLDPATIQGYDEMRRGQGGRCNQFKHDLNQYLAGLGERAPQHSLEEIIKSRKFHPS